MGSYPVINAISPKKITNLKNYLNSNLDGIDLLVDLFKKTGVAPIGFEVIDDLPSKSYWNIIDDDFKATFVRDENDEYNCIRFMSYDNVRSVLEPIIDHILSVQTIMPFKKNTELTVKADIVYDMLLEHTLPKDDTIKEKRQLLPFLELLIYSEPDSVFIVTGV